MKLVKQTTLEYREGNSDKVYEVDLCEVGNDRYVVNFRYGRRGASLRDSSKTPRPVGLAQAQRVFDSLVASKTKKGYRERPGSPAASPGSTTTTSTSSSPSSPSPARTDHPARGSGRTPGPREQAILERLRQVDAPASAAERRGGKAAWSRERAIWRAGELGIAEAEPILIELFRGARKDLHVVRYSIVWALGRVATPGSAPAIALLEAVTDADGEADSTRRIAIEGLRRLYDDDRRQSLIDGYIGRLPGELGALARTGPASEFTAALRALLDGQDSSRKAGQRALPACYLIDNEHVRPGLCAVLGDKPLGKNYFVHMRHIFKAAEFRRDGEVFGILAHRFEKTRTLRKEGTPERPDDGKRVYRYARRDTTEPFPETTRAYLRRRIWRTLRHLGQAASPDYVRMATGVLLPFRDDDAGEAMTRTYRRWRKPNTTSSWDRFASYWAFNHILHGHSPRYQPDDNSKAWRCRPPYQPGGAAPATREESFPALWDAMPAALLHLLDESACLPVHEFAVKALRDNPGFLGELDAGAAIMLLGRPYDVTVALGVTVAERLYDPARPDIELLIAVSECRLDDARAAARAWIDRARPLLSQNTRLMASLASSAHRDNRLHARNLLRVAFLPGEAAQALIVRLIAVITSLGDKGTLRKESERSEAPERPEEVDDNERIADIAATLLACFPAEMARLGVAVVADLVAHPAAAAQELGGRLLLDHPELARQAPAELLMALLDSPHESVRAMGTELFGRMPESALYEQIELLVLLSVHEHGDLRNGIRPVIARLARGDRRFAVRMVDQLIAALMHKQERGVHSHLLVMLAEDLRDHLGHVDRDLVWQLLHHKHPQAQELGGMLLAARLNPDDLSVAEIVKLASHEILSIRRGAWAMCEAAIDRIKRAMPTAVRLLDARWQDSREFAFGFFRDRLGPAELTPDILVAICDSIRPEVQQFGRELITRYFREEDGQTYLLRLSEHPAESLQLFATSYLERYAAGQPARIAELEPYFTSVLSRVNKGRVARQRCIAFLRHEALGNRDSAIIAARIFARQSATIAIGNKADMIEAMVHIARAYHNAPGAPDSAGNSGAIALPIRIHDAPPVTRDSTASSARGHDSEPGNAAR